MGTEGLTWVVWHRENSEDLAVKKLELEFEVLKVNLFYLLRLLVSTSN